MSSYNHHLPSSTTLPLRAGSPNDFSMNSIHPPSTTTTVAIDVPARPFRTPSPSPKDIEALKKGVIDWKALMNWRNWAKRKFIGYYIALILSGVLVALLSIYHTQIVDALAPASQYLKTLNGGWAIPIAIMFVLSFPPLFGNEIVHVLCGIVWGLWIGFGIVCAGTFIGEVGNFYAFKYICQARGDKLEKNSLVYGTLASVVREGGFLIAVVIRLSIIPGHLTTAVFATCGMNIWSFCLGAFLSLPKQFATVYIGVVLYEAAGVQTTAQKLISAAVLSVTIGVTIFAGWWILRKMDAAKPSVIHDRRRAKAWAEYTKSGNTKAYSTDDIESSEYHTGPSTIVSNHYKTQGSTAPGSDFTTPFNYTESATNLPLSVKPQRWDADGRAILDSEYGGLNNNNWAQRPPPPGAAPAAVVSAVPDIRLQRASGASSLQGGMGQYDIPLDSVRGYEPQHRAQQPGRTSPSDDVKTPLTANMRMGNVMSPVDDPVPSGRDYNTDVEFVNPYGDDAGAGRSRPQYGRETTDGTNAGSFYTAPSTTPPPPGLGQRPGQYPPSGHSGQQQQQYR